MFKSLNIQTGQDVVSLDPVWSQEGARENLRGLGRQDFLVCPGCKKPVRLRAGEEKLRRMHFAHKQLLDDCIYTDESPALRNARAVLYEWLVSKYGNSVTIEKRLDDEGLIRPVDCWVEKSSKIFAYWIFDSGMKTEKKELLKNVFQKHGVKANWVFTGNMLKPDQDDHRHLSLSTTERDFMKRSIYDELSGDFPYDTKSSLHYLDADTRTLTTYRRLHCYHKPQVYAGDQRTTSLDELRISPGNGEFVHPGEHELLMKRREEETAREAWIKEIESGRRKLKMNLFQETLPPPPDINAKVGTCIHCGKKTADHWFYDNATGECECNECKTKD